MSTGYTMVLRARMPIAPNREEEEEETAPDAPNGFSNKKALAVFTKHFQWKLMAQLKSKKTSPSEDGSILIPEGLFHYFKETFEVSGRFKPNVKFISSLSLINNQYINNTDYCIFNKEEMEVRVARTRKVSHKDENLVDTKFSSGLFLFSYQFIRLEKKVR